MFIYALYIIPYGMSDEKVKEIFLFTKSEESVRAHLKKTPDQASSAKKISASPR